MRLDEGPEPCLPEDVGQARIAMQLMVALDQALTLCRQALRQETEIAILSLVGESRVTCIVSDRCHGFYRPTSLIKGIDFAQWRSITSRDIYLRWSITVIFIEKK